MAEYIVKDGSLTAIADGFRSSRGVTDKFTLAQMAEMAAEKNEFVLQEKTVTPTTSAQSVTPDSGYDGLSKVNVNAMPTATQATPSITVSSDGLITAKSEQSAGYVPAGTKTATKQLTTQAAKTVTPSTSEQTAVASGVYTTGAVKVAAIPSDYVKPTGTKTITENGTHDVMNYASAKVEVAGEDVTAETSAYTTELAELTTAVTALEEELAGKAAGGGGAVETVDIISTQRYPDIMIGYTDSNMTWQYLEYARNTIYTAAKGTLVYISGQGFIMSGTTLITKLEGQFSIALVTG